MPLHVTNLFLLTLTLHFTITYQHSHTILYIPTLVLHCFVWNIRAWSPITKMFIVAEIPGFLQVFSDGMVKRFAPEIVPASAEESYSNGLKFKDVVIDSSKPITARLFLPDTRGSASQLPVVVYFHGGCFCSTTWFGFHHFLGDLSKASQSIVLSVDYRLAPENRLPIAYDDCFSSLEWPSNNASSQPWLKLAGWSFSSVSLWRQCWREHYTPCCYQSNEE